MMPLADVKNSRQDNNFKRVILIVLDGVGAGASPDSGDYGDQDAATLQHVAQVAGGLNLPHLEQLGLGHVTSIAGVTKVSSPAGCWGKMAEKSAGKDSVTGHWELTGVVLDRPFAVFPDGFPEAIINAFIDETGLKPLGNIASSGTDILISLGEEHLQTGRPIVYTSTDSVFQIAAHEDVVSPERLYTICRQAEKILHPYNVCRVIARPFRGTDATNFYRTSGRHDFPCKPKSQTVLELLKRKGLNTYAIGKIGDLFAGEGITHSLSTRNNHEGMSRTLTALDEINRGLIMTNLVDFDMLYGHRLDSVGFATALQEFDSWLPELLGKMKSDDLLIITADHGCDPTTSGTDHSREYVPLLLYSAAISVPQNLGIRQSFADVGATVADNFHIALQTGQSFLSNLR
ncbi:phosphopentomutase [Desulfuromusa kysingii]|uniref:Phosphopentomutase n=1 Tax=Desulfuromusa kysingii TaxID=37625 RepID=A0A1H4C3I6_9BACT|nr:phosphopentomutase [Desulfuromusa kysingii]SEA54939.1 phosphopentomutase [Desulfuromusa kysingii]